LGWRRCGGGWSGGHRNVLFLAHGLSLIMKALKPSVDQLGEFFELKHLHPDGRHYLHPIFALALSKEEFNLRVGAVLVS